MNIAIILVAGEGKRMGTGKNKVFLKLKNNPIAYYATMPFEKSKKIDGILVVAKKEEIKTFQDLFARNKFKKTIAVIEGGQERQNSGFKAVKYLENIFLPKQIKNSIAIFHNGDSPFVREQEIEAVIEMARKFGACAVAHPTKDTIKRVNKKGFVEATLERKKLWNIQTPQAIKLNLAIEAFDAVRKKNYLGTDDVSLVEMLGKKVKIIEASPDNIKITTPTDYELAKIIIGKRLK